MNEREYKGLQLVLRQKVTKVGIDTWNVTSESSARKYTVTINEATEACTCMDFEISDGDVCKHIYAAKFFKDLEEGKPLPDVEPMKRQTYRQDWAAYNAAQTNEKDKFLRLLEDMCKPIPDIKQEGRGRRRVPRRDVVFAAILKVYLTQSARRSMCDIRDARAKGHLSKVPNYNTVIRCLQSEQTTDVLQKMVTLSSLPLKAVEENIFAPDGTGFTSKRYSRWFKQVHGNKYEKLNVAVEWVKLHAMVGTHSNVITAAEVTHKNVHDSKLMDELLRRTKQHFSPQEIVADMGYLGEGALEIIFESDAMPYIPFKRNNKPTPYDSLWNDLFYYFHGQRKEFLKHYHQRSNVEATFSSIKRKFGTFVRSTSFMAMKNEVLCKVICHNICCVIQSMYELGVDPIFWKDLIDPPQEAAG